MDTLDMMSLMATGVAIAIFHYLLNAQRDHRHGIGCRRAVRPGAPLPKSLVDRVSPLLTVRLCDERMPSNGESDLPGAGGPHVPRPADTSLL